MDNNKTPPPLPQRPSANVRLEKSDDNNAFPDDDDDDTPATAPATATTKPVKLDPFGDPIPEDEAEAEGTNNNNNNNDANNNKHTSNASTATTSSSARVRLEGGPPPPRPPRPENHLVAKVTLARNNDAFADERNRLLAASGISFDKEERATKFTYNTTTGQWNMEPCRLRIATKSFAEGGMRRSFRAAEYVIGTSKVIAGVVKTFKDESTKPGVVFHEALTQAVAQKYAETFNDLCRRKKIELKVTFLPVWVLLLNDRLTKTGQNVYATLEPYLAGNYIKLSDNAGRHLNDVPARAAQTFSHYTFLASQRKLVCVDIQGVVGFSLPGDLDDPNQIFHSSFKVEPRTLTLTDPQIHSVEGTAFGAGNLGVDGIKSFVMSYQRTEFDEKLGLAPLTSAQLALLPKPGSILAPPGLGVSSMAGGAGGKNDPPPFDTDELAAQLANEAHEREDELVSNGSLAMAQFSPRLAVDPKRIQDFSHDGDLSRLSLCARSYATSISNVI